MPLFEGQNHSVVDLGLVGMVSSHPVPRIKKTDEPSFLCLPRAQMKITYVFPESSGHRDRAAVPRLLSELTNIHKDAIFNRFSATVAVDNFHDKS